MICAEPCAHVFPECVQHEAKDDPSWRSCSIPVRFDPKDPRWEGAFSNVWFTGRLGWDKDRVFGTGAIFWMSHHPWFWEPFRAAVVAITNHVRERHGVACQIELAVGGSGREVILYVNAQAFSVGEGQMTACFTAEQDLEILPAVMSLLDTEHRYPWGINIVAVQLGVKEMPAKPYHMSAEEVASRA